MSGMISISHLYFSYTGGAPYLLRDLSFNIEEGSYASIIGMNGAGKTTLMRLVLGFLSPSSGWIRVATKAIGYVPQTDPTSMAGFPITVEELLFTFASAKGMPGSDRDEAVEDVLEAVGMAGMKRSLFPSLSGGERQRVLLARALLGENRLLILDEPSTGIDLRSQRELYALLKGLNRQRGITIVAVEHNLAEAVASSTELIHLRDGRAHICSPAAYQEEEKKELEPDRNEG